MAFNCTNLDIGHSRSFGLVTEDGRLDEIRVCRLSRVRHLVGFATGIPVIHPSPKMEET